MSLCKLPCLPTVRGEAQFGSAERHCRSTILVNHHSEDTQMLTSIGLALTRSLMKDMLTAEDRKGSTPLPAQVSIGARSTKPINDGGRRHLFAAKDPARHIGMHRRHAHASAVNQQAIIDIDRRLVAHLREHGSGASVMPLLEKMFNMPIFRIRPVPEEWRQALDTFHACPTNLEGAELNAHAEALTEAFKTHVLKIEGPTIDSEDDNQRLKQVKDLALNTEQEICQ